MRARAELQTQGPLLAARRIRPLLRVASVAL